MIDTIKLRLSFTNRPDWLSEVAKNIHKDANTGGVTTAINPSQSLKKAGIYLPRLNYREQPTRDGLLRILTIDLSLPKLVFGDNFNELSDADFNTVLAKLSTLLQSAYGIYASPEELAESSVSKIDYSKNIVFVDYTPVSTVVRVMATADVSRVYDVQKDTFKNGGRAYHIHTNSLDVIMYDKVSDLRQARISTKRSIEKDACSAGLVDTLEANKSLTVPRFEVRLNSARKIRKEMSEIGFSGGIIFRELYSSELSQKILLKHWGNIFDRIPKAEAIADTEENMLIALKQNNPDMKFTEACRSVLLLQIRKNAVDERYVRNLIDGLFGAYTYSRYRNNGREPPPPSQLKTLLRITDELKAMEPVSISKYC